MVRNVRINGQYSGEPHEIEAAAEAFVRGEVTLRELKGTVTKALATDDAADDSPASAAMVSPECVPGAGRDPSTDCLRRTALVLVRWLAESNPYPNHEDAYHICANVLCDIAHALPECLAEREWDRLGPLVELAYEALLIVDEDPSWSSTSAQTWPDRVRQAAAAYVQSAANDR